MVPSLEPGLNLQSRIILFERISVKYSIIIGRGIIKLKSKWIMTQALLLINNLCTRQRLYCTLCQYSRSLHMKKVNN